MVDVDIFYVQLVYIYYGHLVQFVDIWYILWLFGIFPPVLVCCTEKNLATLEKTRQSTLS
jgi:hypothetical protein